MSALPASPRNAGGVVLAVGALLLVPLAALVATAIRTFDAEALAHLARTVLAETVLISSILAAGTLVGTVLLGVSCAWCIERYQFPGRNALSWMLVLPLAMPTYVIAYAYTDLLQYSGPVQYWMRVSWGYEGHLPDVRSLTGAVVLFSFVFYPYIYLMTRTGLAEMSSSAIESARLLGQSRWGVFVRVVRPLIMPSIVAGAMLVLMETLADVGATHYFGLSTFSAGIYKTWFAMGSRSAALMLAVVLLGAVVGIYLIERRARGRAMQVTSRTHRPWAPERLSTGRGAALTAALLVPVLIGFVIPVVGLLWLLAREPAMVPSLERFRLWAGNSFVAGTVGATVTLMLAIAFAYAVRFSESVQARLLRFTAASLKFGYAVPGAVVALAILWPMAVVDRAVTDALDLAAPLLTHTIVGLVYAYMLRFFAVAYGGVEASMQRITPNLDSAARTLGSTRLQVFWRVHVPLLRRAALVAWMLVLIDVMKELPATLMLRPFNFDTLAVIAQQLSQDERLAEAALPSLAIVAIGIVPVILISRLLQRDPLPM
ncbi:MAG TPA: iron ABC transporter permease [Lautropia sp.]|nr:iron ABC transporter permease [Lautropia sp.]